LQNGEEEIRISESKFLPSLELVKWDDSLEINKILTPNGIDMSELLTIIEPSVIINFRNKEYTDSPYNTRSLIYPMRVCKISDF
jgi:hypothetical protein